MPLPKVPKRIASNVRVQETKGERQIETVVTSTGQRRWEVRFNGEDGTEIKSSTGALRIYREGCGKQPTPKKASTFGVVVAPKTGYRKARGNGKDDKRDKSKRDLNMSVASESSKSSSEGSKFSQDSKSNEDETSEGGSSSEYGRISSSKSSSSSDFSSGNNSSSGAPPRNKCTTPDQIRKKRRGILSSAKRLLKGRGGKKGKALPQTQLDERLAAPHPLFSYESFGNNEESDGHVFIPADDEEYDNETEDLEDNNGMGDARVIHTEEGTRLEYILTAPKIFIFIMQQRKK